MKLRTWAVAALALCALTTGGRLYARQHVAAEALQAEPTIAGDEAESVAPQAENYADDMDSELGSYQHADVGAGYESCDAGCCPSGGGMGFMDRPISLVFGAEFIWARASFSEALAFVNQDLIAGGEDFVE